MKCCVQDDLVQFYQLQMSVHHPHGAVDESSGAFAIDWTVWKVSLFVFCIILSLPSFVRDKQSLAAFRHQLNTVLFRTSFGEDANT